MTKADRPTFAAFLGSPISGGLVEKGFFGGPFVRYSKFLLALAYLFEMGALLGRARSEKVTVLAEMMVNNGSGAETIAELQKIAEEWLAKWGESPDSLIGGIYRQELTSQGVQLDSVESLSKSKQLFDRKVGLNDSGQALQVFTYVGIAFGSRFPELTEQLYRHDHEQVDSRRWAEYRAWGLSLPETPTVVRLEEQVNTVLTLTAAYAHQYFPHLLEALDLQEFL